jgi:hypothetical protein
MLYVVGHDIYTSTIRWQSTAIVAYIGLVMYKPATERVCRQGSLMTDTKKKLKLS